MKPQFFLPKRAVGVDIGTFSIKIVELSSFFGRIRLENYGEIFAEDVGTSAFKFSSRGSFLVFVQESSKGIQHLLAETKIKTKKIYFGIPDFLSFFSTFEIPPMTKEELPFAIEAEAKRHIPLPLNEVVWDWEILGKTYIENRERWKILLVATPREIVNQYQIIVSNLKIESFSLEVETFSLARALAKKEKGVVGIVDLGMKTTSCSVVENGQLKISHTFDFSGDEITERISKSLGISMKTADQIKRKYGLIPTTVPEGEHVFKILKSTFNIVCNEINRIFENFRLAEGKEVKKIILAGGEANIPGALQHFRDYFKKEVEIANPFKDLVYPPVLENTLKELGPTFAIAVGLAKKGLE